MMELSLPRKMGGFGITRAIDVAYPAYVNARYSYRLSYEQTDEEKSMVEDLVESWSKDMPQNSLNRQEILASSNPQRMMMALIFESIQSHLMNSVDNHFKMILNSCFHINLSFALALK
jgi:hypothetical protein